jgi:predicted molibdopterin-dependent oxidoreductase YjgC
MLERVAGGPCELVTVVFDGRPLQVPADTSVAAALLAAGVTSFRTTPAKNAPRGPYCMMGACFDCLLTIDGDHNAQACLVTVKAGMRIERELGAAVIAPPGHVTEGS